MFMCKCWQKWKEMNDENSKTKTWLWTIKEENIIKKEKSKGFDK